MSITGPYLRKLVNDIAVTIKVHPISLGLEAERDGRLYVARDLKLRAIIIDNVWIAAKARREGKQLVPPHGSARWETLRSEHTIPNQVVELRSSTNARAIIIVEHRNVAISMARVQESFKSTIIVTVRAVTAPARMKPLAITDIPVKTEGYPSLGCCMFLNRLWRLLSPRGCKFLYFGDHDVQGCQIFTTIKLGARASAWADDTACPGLIHMGPTREQVMSHHRRLQGDGLTAEHLVLMNDCLRKKMTCCSVTGVDWSLMAGMQNLNVFKDEPVLEREMKALLEGEGVRI